VDYTVQFRVKDIKTKTKKGKGKLKASIDN
jgi:hypothetical protein